MADPFIGDSSQLAARIVGIRESNHLLGVPLVDGALVQYGTVSGLSVTAGNTAVSTVTFSKPFSVAPIVFCSIANVANTLDITVMGLSVTTLLFQLNYANNSAATNETNLSVNWLAIGR